MLINSAVRSVVLSLMIVFGASLFEASIGARAEQSTAITKVPRATACYA